MPKNLAISKVHKTKLKRVLGIGDLAAIGYGDLGSSIYYTLGVTAVFALGATPLALLIAGLIFACTALTYAEMSSTFPDSGGSASFARQVFNDAISFLAGWALLLDYIVTIAISVFAIGPYLAFFFVSLENPSLQIGLTFGLLVFLFLMNLFGTKQSTRISFVLVGFTLFVQLAIIIIGFGWIFDFSTFVEHLKIGVTGVDWSPTWPEFWKGTAMAAVAYTGIESIAQLGSEAKVPSKMLPRAIIIVLCILLFMYMSISAVALSAMSPLELATVFVNDPIAGIAERLPFGGTFLAPLIAMLAPAILFAAANAGLVGASRLSFRMGELYQIPGFFQKIHKKYHTPYLALIFFAVLAFIVVWISGAKLSILADLYNFGAMLSFFTAHMSLIFSRIRQPDIVRPFRIPLNIRFGKVSIPFSSIVGVLGTFGIWVLVIVTKPYGRYLGFAWMAVGFAMYMYYRYSKGLPVSGQLDIQSVSFPEIPPFTVKNILVPIQDMGSFEAMQVASEFAKLHEAKIFFVHMIEIPPSMPLDVEMLQEDERSEFLLKKAEAIAREYDVKFHCESMRARSLSTSFIEKLTECKADLLVLGTLTGRDDPAQKGLPSLTEKIIKGSSCRVFICSGSSPVHS